MVAELLDSLPQQVEALGPMGSAYFVGLYVFSQLLVVVPAITMTITSGYLFGVPMGFGLSLLGSMAAATAGFFLSRTVLQPQVMHMAAGNETVAKISKAVEREGFKVVLLSRLALVLPFSPLNYAFGGLSNVSFKDFFMGTFLAFGPETFAIVYFASSARSIFGEGANGEPWYVYVIGAIVVATLLHQVTELAKSSLDDAVEGDEVAMPATPLAATASNGPILGPDSTAPLP